MKEQKNVARDKCNGMNSTLWLYHTLFITDNGEPYIAIFKALASIPKYALASWVSAKSTNTTMKIINKKNMLPPKLFLKLVPCE